MTSILYSPVAGLVTPSYQLSIFGSLATPVLDILTEKEFSTLAESVRFFTTTPWAVFDHPAMGTLALI